MSKMSLTKIVLVIAGLASLVDLGLAKINPPKIDYSFNQKLFESRYLFPAIAIGIIYGGI